MFIQTEQTPNPETLKFLPGRPVLEGGARDFAEAAEAAGISPLAERLFGVDGVDGVFLGADFISVTKDEETQWHLIKPLVLGAIMDHFTSGEPTVLGREAGSGHATRDFGDDQEIVDQIVELLDTRVRPAVAQDGGDIVFKGFDKGVVYLVMRGACAGCPSSTATLKQGIETMLKHYVPEVTEVRAAA